MIHHAPPFKTWLNEFKTDAKKQGITQQTLDTALQFDTPLKKVVSMDKTQAEFVKNYWKYTDSALNPWRISHGKKMLKKHKALFAEIKKKYNMPAHYLVAFWAMETNFGKYKGDINIPHALVSLAYEGRREAFFKNHLMIALKMIQDGHIKASEFKGSWAGAFGHLQFMPETYKKYAIDGDGDGKIDLINSIPDAMHSAANYLTSIGWDGNWRWGRQVTIPNDFYLEAVGSTQKRSLSMWQRMGVMDMNGKPIPKGRESATIVLPAGINGPIMMLYGNFDLILQWNTSLNYALSVGHLADKLIGIHTIEPENSSRSDRPLTLDEVKEIQTRLGVGNYYRWEIDGWIGKGTRSAIRLYQADNKLIPDGYANHHLLKHLRKTVKLPTNK